MNRFLGRMGLVVVMCGIVVCGGAVQAEQKKVSGMDKFGPMISETSMPLGDVANHRLVMSVRRDTTTSPDPEFNETELIVHSQNDVFATGNTHKGYARRLFKNGDTTYAQYEGATKVAAKGDGSQEVTWEGRWQFTSGTGKFKNIKGGGTYRGRITGQGALTSWEGEVEY